MPNVTFPLLYCKKSWESRAVSVLHNHKARLDIHPGLSDSSENIIQLFLKYEAGLVRVSGPQYTQISHGWAAQRFPDATTPETLLIQRFQGQKPTKPHKQVSPFSKLPLSMRPLVNLVVYCYTHPRAMLGLFNTLYPKSWRGPQKGPLTDQYLPIFEPRRTVAFKSADGLNLKGHWMPAPNPSKRTVILGHGYFADWRNMIAIAEELRKNNYNTFLFDFRAHGQSGGKKTSFGYNEGKDIAGAIRFVTEKYPKESQSLFYYGHSMGAASMMMAQHSLKQHPRELALLNKHIKGMVLDSAYSNFKEMVERFVQNVDSLEADSAVLKKLGRVAGVPLKRVFPSLMEGIRTVSKDYTDIDVEFDEIRPAELYANEKPPQKPILILHGLSDRVIHAKHGQVTYDTVRAHNTDTRIEFIKGVDHITRKWDPAGDGNQFNSALRNKAMTNHAVQFFNAIKFGFSGGIKALLPAKSR